MTSTFHGLQTAYKGLMGQQSALKTTGHNIGNANTEGYTRQRVNFSASQAYPAPGTNAPSIPGQIGTGVEVENIQRVREHFLDAQYRGENANAGYWEQTLTSMERMEEVMNEQSETGLLAEAMDVFWGSLHDLSANPDDASAREVTAQRAAALADTYNHMTGSLETNKRGAGDEIQTSEQTINGLLTQIHDLNEGIAEIEAQGQIPNDLYDQRDRVVDELSEHINIEVKEHGSPGGHTHPAAEGGISIFVVDDDGNRLGDDGGVSIVDGEDGNRGHLELSVEINDEESLVESINFGDEIELLGDHHGKLGALVDAFGYDEDEGIYQNMITDLNHLMMDFTDAFNEVHQAGVDLNGDPGVNFFDLDDEGELSVNQAILDDTDLIAAAQSENTGDGSNALALADVKDTSGFDSTYQSIIGGMAIDVDEARRMNETSMVRRDTIDMNRQSVSSVSLDEEMTNMIQFQHAYNASSRMITVIDEMLDQVINQMGIVGR